MAKLTFKEIKGKKYAYLEHSIRINNGVRKISKYLGLAGTVSKKQLREAEALFQKEILNKKLRIRMNFLREKITHFEFPLNTEEAEKIEEMNLKYAEIIKKLHPKNSEDLNKRFIANYVFASNALEGNSLTLKNVAEIVFENRISQGKDLREIYDAQNSYAAFLFLQKTRHELNHEFIIKLHARLMDRIDDRLGYRTVPVALLGKPITELTAPEKVYTEMNELLKWHKANQDKIHPLELAFKFHAKFEKIHPFCDGNGRTGRFLLNYILIKKGYFPIIIRTTARTSYLKSLEAADRQKWIVLMRFALKHYKETFSKFFEVYYKYVQ